MSDIKKEIFVSYAWGGESENVVNDIDSAFQNKGITIVRDKRDLGFKGEIKNFMRRIGKGKFVIVIISNKYLKSPNCMFEMMEINKNEDWKDRIFPIVLSDAKIYKPLERIPYFQHWEKERDELEQGLKSIDLTYTRNLANELDFYSEVRRSLDYITDTLSNLNALTPEIHKNANFQQIYDEINAQLELDNSKKKSIKDKIGHFLYLKCNRKLQQQKFHTKFHINIQQSRKKHFFAMCCEEADVPDTMIQRFREELITEHLKSNLFYQRVYHTIENDDLENNQEAIKYELCNRFDTAPKINLQATEFSELIKNRKLGAAVVSHQLKLKVWNAKTMEMIRWLVSDFWNQLPATADNPHFILFFNFILSDLDEGGFFGMFKKNDHSKVKAQLEKHLKDICQNEIGILPSPPKITEQDIREWAEVHELFSRMPGVINAMISRVFSKEKELFMQDVIPYLEDVIMKYENQQA